MATEEFKKKTIFTDGKEVTTGYYCKKCLNYKKFRCKVEGSVQYKAFEDATFWITWDQKEDSIEDSEYIEGEVIDDTGWGEDIDTDTVYTPQQCGVCKSTEIGYGRISKVHRNKADLVHEVL